MAQAQRAERAQKLVDSFAGGNSRGSRVLAVFEDDAPNTAGIVFENGTASRVTGAFAAYVLRGESP